MSQVIRIMLASGLAAAALAAAMTAENQGKPQTAVPKADKQPIYRSFLIPGNPLDEKIKEQEKLVEESPNSASLHNDFGNLLALRRFPKEAREQYEIAIKLDKHNFLALYNLGIVYETEGKISSAISSYEKCVERNRGFPPGLFRLARLYEKRGRDRKAIETYAKAMRIDPGMRDPRHNPLVVDTLLLDRVSLTNYERDLATATLSTDARYAEEARFRSLPYDRAIYSEEAEVPASPRSAAPAFPPTPGPQAPAAIPAAPGQTRPQAIAPAPPSAIPPTAVRPNLSVTSPLPPGAPVYAPTPAPPGITPIPPPPTPEGR